MRNLFFLVLVLCFLSCEKESNFHSPQESQFSLKTVEECTEDFEYNFQSALLKLAESVYEEYPMDIFCTCDCNAYESLSNALNERLSFVPELFSFEEPRPFDCTQGQEMFGHACNLSIDENYIYNAGLLDSLASYVNLNSKEKNLLSQLNSDIKNGKIDICETVEISRELNYSSEISKMIVLSSIGFVDMVLNEHMIIFNPDLNEGDDVQGLIAHALGAVGGAWFSGVKWAWENRHDMGSGEGLFYEMAWGAAGGALTSV